MDRWHGRPATLQSCVPTTNAAMHALPTLCTPQHPPQPPSLPYLPTTQQTASGVRVQADPPMHQVLPLWTYPVCSSLCSATASIATHPIDVVKTRLQVLSNRVGSSGGQRLTAWQVGAGTCKLHWVAACWFDWRGLSSACLPAVAMWCLNGALVARPPAQVCRQLCAQEGLTHGNSRYSAAPPPPSSHPRVQVCRQLYAQEGLRGFARGIGARWVCEQQRRAACRLRLRAAGCLRAGRCLGCGHTLDSEALGTDADMLSAVNSWILALPGCVSFCSVGWPLCPQAAL